MTFKEAAQGSTIYVLMKGEELKYTEGTLTQVSQTRTELPKQTDQFPAAMPQMRQVIDVTYTIEGQTFTDAVDVFASSFPTNNTGQATLISVDKEAILRELTETQKQAENILKDVPKLEKRLKKCKDLIGKLDVASAEKQKMEKRLDKLEESTKETNALLKQLMEKMTQNKLF